MFKNYYSVLGIHVTATQSEIITAFKKQAIKWHPDKNPDIDTTREMQDINEAYLILKDSEAKERYDKEFYRFWQFQSQKEKAYQENRKSQYENSYDYPDYDINDDLLKKWMENAKKQAVDLAKQTIEDFRKMSILGVKAAVKGAGQQLIYQIIIGIIFLLIIALARICAN